MHELDQMTPNQRPNTCNAGHSIYVGRCMWDDSSREKKLTGE